MFSTSLSPVAVAYVRAVQRLPEARSNVMNRILAGLLSGFAATVPMTAAMVAMHRLLPWRERYPLPPRRVTMNVADAAQVKHRMDEPQRTAVTLVAHFGYGAAMGGVYAAVEGKVPGPPVAKGIGWGLVVWSASYLGLLPALRLHEPATREPAVRNALMILAHVVWGASLGAMTARTARTSGPATSAVVGRRVSRGTRTGAVAAHPRIAG
jgi:uncharacterized membrane protein YagU involved in acid resistance